MKILIIEDDKETHDYVSAGLKEAGHTVDSTGDGFEGLLLAKKGKHDLLMSIECYPALMDLRW
jgi:two-component system, OmpR family, response regulator